MSTITLNGVDVDENYLEDFKTVVERDCGISIVAVEDGVYKTVINSCEAVDIQP